MDFLSLQLEKNMNKNLSWCVFYQLLCVMKGAVFFPAHVCADLTLIKVLYEIYMTQVWQTMDHFIDPDKP